MDIADSKDIKIYEIVIIGGSASGLGCALTLARSNRNVLIIDSHNPRNKPSKNMHNFLTHDGLDPTKFLEFGRNDVKKYNNLDFINDKVVDMEKKNNIFKIQTLNKKIYNTKKVVLATGIKDDLPDIKGIKELWGNGVYHCPYCHGWELKNKSLCIIGNDNNSYNLLILLSQWSKNITIITNGESKFTELQKNCIKKNNIKIIENEIIEVKKINDNLIEIKTDFKTFIFDAIFIKPPFIHHDIINKINIEKDKNNLIKVDDMFKTNIDGIYAVGDIIDLKQQVILATSSGVKAAFAINAELINISWNKSI